MQISNPIKVVAEPVTETAHTAVVNQGNVTCAHFAHK